MTTARIKIPPKLIPVFLGEARVRGAYGGRGSAKTRTFAKMTAVRGFQWSEAGEEGLIVGAREYMNSLDESSMAEIKAAILSEPFLADHYEIGEKFIRTRDRRIEYDFIGLHRNLDSVKSKARIRLALGRRGRAGHRDGVGKAIPSVREDDSEVWVTWNPERKSSATTSGSGSTRRPTPRLSRSTGATIRGFPPCLRGIAWRTWRSVPRTTSMSGRAASRPSRPALTTRPT
jgi:phage terminase large subunit